MHTWGMDLDGAIQHWPWAGGNDWKGTSKPGQRRGQLDEAAEQLYPISLPVPETSQDGSESSPSTPPSRQLNPRFAAWLMGWDPGWTSLAPLGSASSATESSPSKPPLPSEPCGQR